MTAPSTGSTKDLKATKDPRATQDLQEVMASLPALLETLRGSYSELESRAERVEEELSRTNAELQERVHELDVVKRHLEAVLDSMPGGVIVRDASGRVQRVNHAAEELLGLDPQTCARGDAPDLVADGEPHRFVTPGGRSVVVAASRADVRLSDGSLDGTVEVLDDQTERAALREQLHAADKMAALGTMAAGIAHEIRNPLNAVEGFAALLRRRDDLPQACVRWASAIVEGVEEVDAIIENLLSFGSPERLRREVLDARELLAEAAELAFRDLDPAQLEVELDADCPPFVGDRIKLRQAVRNLLANAADIQPGNARVRATLRLDTDPVPQVVVRVSDAGPGVAPELRRRILDPFFTTRADGTGLGLALVSTIVRLHGGAVEIAPDPSPLGGADIGFRIPFRPHSPTPQVDLVDSEA